MRCATVRSAVGDAKTKFPKPSKILAGEKIMMTKAAIVTPDRVTDTKRQLYPNSKVIVLNDDFNTFEHVHGCLLKYIPGMDPDQAWDLTNQVHFDGLATVWTGPQEQAELYHEQLRRENLTMAPLEAA
jgi:ATP-dependent Clp protease adaptor protein ClpS